MTPRTTIKLIPYLRSSNKTNGEQESAARARLPQSKSRIGVSMTAKPTQVERRSTASILFMGDSFIDSRKAKTHVGPQSSQAFVSAPFQSGALAANLVQAHSSVPRPLARPLRAF